MFNFANNKIARIIRHIICLFAKCFVSPHSGESEVIYFHVLPQSITNGGCQCISLNRKVPLTPIPTLQCSVVIYTYV